MTDFALTVRGSQGLTLKGTHYVKGALITPSTDQLLLEALAEVGSDVEIHRVVAPGGRVPLHTAIHETWEKLLVSEPSEINLSVDVFTDVPTADADAFLTTKASTNGTTVTYLAAALDGVVGDDAVEPARNVTVTVAGTTAAESFTSLAVTGEDVNGDALTETIAITAAAATYAGVKAFRKITSLVFTGGTGTGATVTVGHGVKLGLTHYPTLRDGKIHVVSELTDGAHPGTAATLVSPATGAPNGTFSPNSAPNGSRTYTVVYEAGYTTLVKKKRGLLPSP